MKQKFTKRYCLFVAFIVTTLLILSACGHLRAESGEKIRHIKVGELDFYSIQDAPLEIENESLVIDNQNILKRLAPSGKAASSYGVFVVQKGSDAVLIDTGTGGQLLPCLQKIGIKPEDIKIILLTHSHGDHVDGLIKNGRKVFPNAEIRLDARELEFWKSAQNKALCEQCLKLYVNMKFLTPDEKTPVVFPEMLAVDLAGHTPGHTGFLISSSGEKLLVAADLLHSGAVQFARPDVGFRYDNNLKQAVEIRRKILQRAADENLLFVACHLPFPSAGYVKVDGDGFRFEPIPEIPAETKSRTNDHANR